MELDIVELKALYDEGRFLDAYARTREAWDHPERAPELSAEHLAYGSRLAERLGGPSVRNWLCRLALAKDPNHPAVRSFALSFGRARVGPFEELRAFEENPSLEGAEPWLAAGWLARMATLLATYRDFSEAHRVLGEARDLDADHTYVQSCLAHVLLAEGRWPEALAEAEAAFEQTPGNPGVADTWAEAMVKLGRMEEAVARLVPVAEAGQSFDLLFGTIWYVLALGERAEADARRRWGELAGRLAEDLPRRAPLARRVARARTDYMRIESAFLRGDREAVVRYAEASGTRFYRRMASSMRTRETGVVHRAPYTIVSQTHDTCLPASIAAVAGAFGDDIELATLSEATTFGGTPMWRAADWLESRGYVVRHFRLDRPTVIALLEKGIPFVVIAERVRGSHALAVVGLDVDADLLILHDPSMERLARFRLDAFLKAEAPTGPAGMAFVPEARARDLEVVPEIQRRQGSARLTFDRWLFDSHHRRATQVVEAAERDDPEAEATRYLRSALLVRTGHLSEGMERLAELRRTYPDNPRLLTEHLNNLSRTRDTVRNVKALADIVEHGRAPGFAQDEPWRYPDSQFVSQYADFLGVNEEGFAKAERLLTRTLRRFPFDDRLLHILADVLERQGRQEDSVLPHRLASFLDESDDHSARSVANALRAIGREEEGVTFLRQRAERLGRRAGGATAWVCYLDALEDFGRLDVFEAEMERAREACPSDAGLLRFLTEALTRAGRWAQADLRFRDLEATSHPVHVPAAGAMLAARRGQWHDALALAEAWVEATPEALSARRTTLDVLEQLHGIRASVERAQTWADQRPGDEDLEDLLLSRLSDANDWAGYLERLRARIARNPGDTWAHRELVWRLAERLETGTGDLESMDAEMREALARAEALAPRDWSTLGVKALVLDHDGKRVEAIEALLEAVDLRPGHGWAIRRAWDLADDAGPEVQARVRDRLSELVTREHGNLHEARTLALRIADRYGLDEAVQHVEAWREARPDDPEVLEALADLWLESGRGLSHAEQARQLLEDVVDRYPWHEDLRHSLAMAYRVLDRSEEAVQTYREVLDRTPRNAVVRSNLAGLLADAGRLDEATELLDEGIRLDPASSDPVRRAARVLWEAGRRDAALRRLRDGVRRNPLEIGVRDETLERLLEAGYEEEAVEVAEEGIEVYPDGAYLHFLLGRTLVEARTLTDRRRAESSLLRALELNERLFVAVDLLSELFVTRGRFREAREVLVTALPKVEERAAVRGRLAWLRYHEGDEAGGIDEMTDLLFQEPTYLWGWRILFGWLQKRKTWRRAEALLEEVPAALASSVEFRSERLLLLEEVQGRSDALRLEWEALIDDFPHSEYLIASRFDSLWAGGQRDEAHALLAPRMDRFRHAEFLLARWVQVSGWKGARREAVAASLEIWRVPDDGNPWAVDTAWEGTSWVEWRREIVRTAMHDLRAGKPLRARAVELMADHAELIPTHGGLRGLLRHRTMNLKTARAIEGLGELMEVHCDHPQGDGSGLADTLSSLRQVGGAARAVAWWEAHRSLCGEQTPVWARMGEILSQDPGTKPEVAIGWLRDWRSRPDAPMYAVTCYVLALRRQADDAVGLRNLRDTAHEALEGLSYDNTAVLLACLVLEASLRGGRDDTFLEDHDRYRALIEDEARSGWLPSGLEPFPGLVTGCRELLDLRAAEPSGSAKERRAWRRDLKKRATALAGQTGGEISLRWVRAVGRRLADVPK